MGSAGQFIYDLLSLRDAARQRPDVHLTLGTTSSAPWLAIKGLRGSAPLAVHLDGLEWMRGKYSPAVQRYLKWAERTAAEAADLLVADHPEMARYAARYAKPCAEIAYGVDDPAPADLTVLRRFGLQPGSYALIIARLVPENHVRLAAEALSPHCPVVVVGPWDNPEGRALQGHPNVHLLGAQFDAEVLNALRAGCGLYVHGHSAGGTNPGPTTPSLTAEVGAKRRPTSPRPKPTKALRPLGQAGTPLFATTERDSKRDSAGPRSLKPTIGRCAKPVGSPRICYYFVITNQHYGTPHRIHWQLKGNSLA
jgi:hypothetical protein